MRLPARVARGRRTGTCLPAGDGTEQFTLMTAPAHQTQPLTELQQKLAPTPFVASWLGRARHADLHDPAPARRASGWAHWTFTSFQQMTGNSDRPYVALTLPGRFYDPKGTGPVLRPHLEVPAHLFDRNDPEFPDRVAQMGNGLLFPWWLVPEVMAAKRALFAVPRTGISELVELLNDRRPSLLDAVESLTGRAAQLWTHVEETLVADPELMSPLAAGDFSAKEVAEFFPPAADLDLRVEFDRKLRDNSRGWASRRVGVWRLIGTSGGDEFVLGAVTPRLTRSSLFSDPLFAPDKESPAALLVRGLVLRRLVAAYSGAGAGEHVVPAAKRRPATSAGLRSVVAHVGEKLPEASVAAAVKFLHAYPDADDAWASLEAWAASRSAGGETRRAVLTVSPDGFAAAHRCALRAVRRAEQPERGDINVILPLAWDAQSRVVRVTFSRPDDA